MKTIRIFIWVLSFIFTYQKVNCQIINEVELSEGLVFTDYLGISAQQPHPHYQGWTTFQAFSFWSNHKISDSFNLRIGSGLLHVWPGGVGSMRANLYYLPVRIGSDYRLKDSKISLTAISSTYFRLNKEHKLSETIRRYERKVFSTLDLGLRIKTGKNGHFSFTSPITIAPIYFIGPHTIFGSNVDLHNTWVETLGINIGYNYYFGK